MRPEDDRAEEIVRAAYAAFNARDLEAAIELMHADVDWPNAWEGGRVRGRAAVAGYWRRQFEAISSKVVPEALEHHAGGEVTVSVHQTVHDAKTGEKLSEGSVQHRFRIADDLIVRMDVVGTEASGASES